MYWYHSHFWGMNVIWWVFWIVLLVAIFGYATPVSRRRVKLYEGDPLNILRSRYAAGQIDTEEYERRKLTLERDLKRPPDATNPAE